MCNPPTDSPSTVRAVGSSRQRPQSLTLIALALLGAACLACGPFFPNRILVGSDDTLTSAPVADFAFELARITPTQRPTQKAIPPVKGATVYGQTADADVAELADSLRRRGVAAAAADPIIDAYRKFRDAIAAYQAAKNAPREEGQAAPQFHIGAPPAGLPGEFADYLSGAVAYHRGNLPAARRAWLILLARPEADRRYRSVWAAFMLGKSYIDADADKAAAHFADTRKLADAGFRDALGLAAASYGWEAKAMLNGGRIERAVQLYLAQHATGDPTAVASLSAVAYEALGKGDLVLNRCAADPTVRRVITASVLAQNGIPDFVQGDRREGGAQRWIKAVEAAGVEDVDGAERLAWMAYQAADYETAARWGAKAGDKSAMALWVRAKLMMRAGRIDDAIATLALAARLMPPDEVWPNSNWYDRGDGASSWSSVSPQREALAEMGALHLTRGQYTEALTLLLDTGYWTDAAYIADQVLALDELTRFVDARKQPADGTRSLDGEGPSRIEQHEALHALLARRLTRNGRWKEARAYFADEHRELLDAYIASIRAGHDASLPRIERAVAFTGAARIARDHGIELLGTELDPDEAIYGGSFGDDNPKPQSYRADQQGPVLKPTADELRRVIAHRPTPLKRWHYRYTAADHAWAAAQLMDDGTDELAAWLQEAGMWLAAKDPQAADRFYKALVRRCPNTALGKEADALRWFPAMKNPPQ